MGIMPLTPLPLHASMRTIPAETPRLHCRHFRKMSGLSEAFGRTTSLGTWGTRQGESMALAPMLGQGASAPLLD